MARRGPTTGDRAPLFERLSDDNPAASGEPRPQRLLDADGIRRSVLAELQRLLNTRRGPAAGRWPVAGTVLGYGVPDHALDNPASVRDQKALCTEVENAIRAFEPRLQDVRVWVADDAGGRGRLALGLTGTIKLDRHAIPVHFPMTLSADGVTVGDDGSDTA